MIYKTEVLVPCNNYFKKICIVFNSFAYFCGLELQHTTFLNFSDIHFDILEYQIYHIGCKPKGEFIKSNILSDDNAHKFYKKIIFVDDLECNLEDVKENLQYVDNLECYKFE